MTISGGANEAPLAAMAEPDEAWVAQSRPVDTGRILRILWFRKWHMLACAVIFGSVAFVLTARQPERFSAEARILLDPRQSNVALSSDQVVSDLEFTTATVESEIARIASMAAIGDVLTYLGLDRLKSLDPGQPEPQGVLGGLDRLKRVLSPNSGNTSDVLSKEERTLQRIVLAVSNGTIAKRVGSSFVITLRVTTVDPELSKLIANQLAQRYVNRQVEERKAIAGQANRWHEEQLESRKLSLSDAEGRVERVRRENLLQKKTDAEVLALQLTEVARHHTEVQSEFAAARSRLGSLEKDLAQSGYRAFSETQMNSPFVELKAEEAGLLTEAARLSSKYGKQHPDRIANAKSLEQIDMRLTAAVQAHLVGLKNEVLVLETLQASLRKDIDRLQAEIVDANAATRQLRQFEIEAVSARESYEELVSRLAEIRTQAEIQLPDARIISPARFPTGPSAPRPKFMGFLGGSIGFSFGFFLVLILEALSRGVSCREEMQQLTGVSSIFVLPRQRISGASDILKLISAGACAPFSERLRQLQLVLRHDEKSRIVLVASAHPNEGSSTIANALAHLNASSGKRTLLIPEISITGALHSFAEGLDGEINFPILTRTTDWGFDRLENENGSPCAALNPYQIDDMRSRYDVVIVDGPPLMSDSAALDLARSADQIVFVTEHMKTAKRSITASLALLRGIDRRPSACVINKFDPRLDPDWQDGVRRARSA